MGRLTRLIASISTVLFGFVLAFLLAEGVVRLFFDEAVQPRFVVDPGYGVRWNQSRVDTRHYVPGDYDVRITTNSIGMRGQREYPVERVMGKRRVVMLGDSFVFGYGVEDSEVVSTVLEDLLNKSAPVGQGYEVINLGVSGFGQAEELVTWRERGRAYNPDVVVLFFFDNDIGNNAVSQLFAINADGGVARTGRDFLPGSKLQERLFQISPARWMFEHSAAWNLIRHRLSSIVQARLLRAQGLVTYDDATPGAASLTRALLLQSIREIQAEGADVIVVVVPNKVEMDSNCPLTPDDMFAAGAAYLDGRDFLSTADYYERDSHWRPSGHRKVAERLRDCLNKVTSCFPASSRSIGAATRESPVESSGLLPKDQ